MSKTYLQAVIFVSLLIGATLIPGGVYANEPTNSFQILRGEDEDSERESWNAKFRSNRFIFGKEPIAFLKENIKLIPKGRALVAPLEEGRNAVFMATQGFEVTGIDFSDVAIKKALRLAKERRATINPINADLTKYRIERGAYDVIVVVEFHRKKFIEEIKSALKPGGYIVYESYTVEQVKNQDGPKVRRDNLLRPNELKSLFDDFKMVVYRETNDGKRAVASLIARKP